MWHLAGDIYYTQLNNDSCGLMRLILLRHVLSVLDVAGLIDPFTHRYGHLASLTSSLAPCCEAMDTGPGEFHVPQEVVQ